MAAFSAYLFQDSLPRPPAPLDEDDDEVEEEVASIASHALISPGEIHLDAATQIEEPDEDWAELIELRSSAGGRA